MQSGKYNCNREFTPEQRENDEIYGIFEVENRTLEINAEALTFKFLYHWYYEKESGYVLTAENSNDTELEGSLKLEGPKLTAVVEKGSQKTKTQQGQKEVGGLKGHIGFLVDGKVLKVEEVHLEGGELERKQWIFCANQSFTKK